MMDTLSTEIKQDVLEFLYNRKSDIISIKTLFESVNPDGRMEMSPFVAYVKEIKHDGFIEYAKGRSAELLVITRKGVRFLEEGGYLKSYIDENRASVGVAAKDNKEGLKIDLEVMNLKENLIYSTKARTLSIIAIVISALSLIFTILYSLLK